MSAPCGFLVFSGYLYAWEKEKGDMRLKDAEQQALRFRHAVVCVYMELAIEWTQLH